MSFLEMLRRKRRSPSPTELDKGDLTELGLEGNKSVYESVQASIYTAKDGDKFVKGRDISSKDNDDQILNILYRIIIECAISNCMHAID